MKRTAAGLISLFVIAIMDAANAAPVDQWFAKANTFYDSEQFDSAARYYERIIESGMTNSAVYYNMGNAYYRQKKLGLAILNYERARALDSNDPEILANIRFANKNMVDRIPEPESGFVESAFWRLHTFFGLNTQIWLLLFVLFILAGLFSAGLYVSRNARLWLVYLGSLGIAIALVLGISAGSKIYSAENVVYAIVLDTTIDAKNKPDGARVLFTVHEGTKFRINRKSGEWSLVSLPNGVSGWVQNSSFGRI